jgi:hypothetical protein
MISPQSDHASVTSHTAEPATVVKSRRRSSVTNV